MSGMRGGPRLMCSPYLTGSLALMLVLVGFNYWSVSTQNQDLLVRTSDMQQQLRVGSDRVQEMETNYSNLKHEHTVVLDEKSQCHEELKRLETSCDEDKKKKDSEISQLKNKSEELLKEVNDLKIECEDNSEKETQLTEEKEAMLREKEDLIKAKEDLETEVENLKKALQASEDKSADLQSKLSELLKQNVHVDAELNNVVPAGNLSQGQLPDVNPAAVSVIKKDTLGPPGISIGDSAAIQSNFNNSLQINQQDESLKQIPFPDNLSPEAASKSNVENNEEDVADYIENKSDEQIIQTTNKVEEKHEEELSKGEDKADKDLDQAKEVRMNDEIENLDRREADSFIPQLENSEEGRKEIQNDDQDPGGDLEDPEKVDNREDDVRADLEEAGNLKTGDEQEKDSQMENEDYDGLKKVNSDIEVL